MSELVVRAYNVGFGDAILVTVPDRDGDDEVERHLLIDVGNVLAGSGGRDDLVVDVMRDVVGRTDGVVDLYVMTHEHLDHSKGPLEASLAGVELRAEWAWLTRSADPRYYDDHPDALRQRLALVSTFADSMALWADSPDPFTQMLLENNDALLGAGGDGRRTTADHVDHIRTLAEPERITYVSRETATAGRHPFTEAALRVLAPEEDTSDYYGRFVPSRPFGATTADDGEVRVPNADLDQLVPPPGVDAGAFFDLLRSRDDALHGGLVAIDKAANNTSLVIELTWRGWVLLFPGDAESRSWRTMLDRDVIRPVHLLKVSHHGSHTGTRRDVLPILFPDPRDGERPRRAIVSTHDEPWESVPDEDTLSEYRDHCAELLDTRNVPPGSALEVRFPDGG